MMTAELSYEDLQAGLHYLDRLLYQVDYAMWLMSEYHTAPDATEISLVKEPDDALQTAVAVYLAEHPGEIPPPGPELCRARQQEAQWHVSQWFSMGWHALRRRAKELGVKARGTRRELVEAMAAAFMARLAEPTDSSRRQGAAGEVMQQDRTLGLRYTVSAWIVQHVQPGRNPDEVRLPAGEVLEHLGAMVAKDVAQLDFRLSGTTVRPPRADLLPRGETLKAQHDDYLDMRHQVIRRYHQLEGLTREHPVFNEAGEAHMWPADFRPPISIPAAVLADAGRDQRPRVTPPRRMKEPSKRALAAYRCSLVTSMNQQEIAAKLTEEFGELTDQPQVSRMIKQVKAFLEAGNVLPEVEPKPRMRREIRSVDPSRIELGPRQDGRRPKR